MTADVCRDLRKWLLGLSAADFGVVLALSAPLRALAHLPAGSGPSKAPDRRAVRTAQAWLVKASNHQLGHVATDVVPIAADLLANRFSFDDAVVADPDLDQLADMLVALGRPFGQLVLFGLLLGDVTASPLAVRHRAELDARLRSAVRRPLAELSAPVQSGCAPLADGAAPEEGGHGADALEQKLSDLRRLSVDVSETLDLLSEVIRAGGEPTGDVDHSIGRYSAVRDDTVALFRHVAGVETDNFAGFELALAGLRADEAARQRDTVRISELEHQISELTGLIVDSSEPVRTHLQAGLNAALEELNRLKPTENDPVDCVVPEEPSDTAAEDDASVGVESDAVTAVAATVDELVEVPVPAEVSPAVAEEPDAPVDEFSVGFPWEEGAPPLAIQLVRAGRLVEAYWVTAMSGEPDRRSEVLRFAAAAYSAHSTVDATAVLAVLGLNAQELAGDQDAIVLLTTAVLRAGLVAGWGHAVLAQLEPELALPEPWSGVVDAAIAAVRRGVRIDVGAGVQPQTDNIDEARVELGRRAEALAEELPRRKNSYQRATRVLQRLMLNGQPLRSALDTVFAWSNGAADGAKVAGVLVRLSEPDAVRALIEDADAAMRTPKQAKEPIVAGALRSLRRAIDEVLILVREADAVNRRLTTADSDDDAAAHRLARAKVDVQSSQPPGGMSGAALALLRRWLMDPDECVCPGTVSVGPLSTEFASVVPEPSPEVLLALPDLPRDPDGRPDRDDPRTASVLSNLGQPIDLTAAVTTYCERGDLRSARRIVELLSEQVWPMDAGRAAPTESVAAAEREWTRRHRAKYAEVRDQFARIRTQNLLDQTEESTVAGRLEALAMVTDGAFDVAMVRLADEAAKLASKQQAWINAIRGELGTLDIGVEDRTRIGTLLDDGDTVTAAEFLSFVRAGKSLPEHAERPTQAASRFMAMLSRGLTDGRVGARAWAELAAADSELTDQAINGVDAWDGLQDRQRHSGDRLANAVREILRTLGLNCVAKPREATVRARQGLRRFRAAASANDGSYVAMLGSAASDYTVVVVFEERRGRSVLDVLGPEDIGHANIVLYVHAMDSAARWSLAAQANANPAQAVVIDPAVMGWVAATAPGSWRATQRVTLPWTAFNPYAPFVAGLVPPEVFVGRTREMAEVMSAQGGLFIYGGRQLGKSALLRRVEATFQDGNLKHAVYLDLKGRGIGEAEPPKRIWRELAKELKVRGVLNTRVSDDPPADVVITQIRNWLTSQPGRHLLVLADEADAFLTADSRGEPSAGGVSHFVNVHRLKELMESTERRFKVVFAGLHQVQRFWHLPNVPLVHGGPPILVGPLDPMDARDLVVQPMAALGYSFERPELVWRLLSATNYQASLVQIFCEELVRRLHSRAPQAQGLPISIRESDVEAVSASDSVRAHIAERLRITINLEDRYRVLTLIIALRSLEDAFSVDYAPDELLELARQRWEVGFEDLTAEQVKVYLDEMAGLGLLIKLSGQSRYAVRSPNVINMLGTKADLERELAETDFDLPYEYNPRDARRLLSVEDGVEVRSPLTDGQLADLTKGGVVSVVAGTVALGITRVPTAVRDYVEMRGNKVEVLSSTAEVAKVIANAARRQKQTVVIADGREWRLADLVHVGEKLAKATSSGTVAAMLLTAPDAADAVADALDVEVVRPVRWTAGSVRSWPECPFDVPQARSRLMTSTGGWPDLVEEAIRRVVFVRSTQAQALEQVRRMMDDPRAAEAFLAEAGLDATMIGRIGPWVDYFEPGEHVSPADVSAALELDLAPTTELLAALADLRILDEGNDGMSLDRVVHHSLTVVRGVE